MKINVTMPFDRIEKSDDFLSMDAVREISQLAEQLGFSGACVTDHPVPSARWLDAGGHYAQDPFVMMSLIAAATKTLRVQTGIVVLPYRNPFITARAVSSLDVFSGGRVSMGFGAGYQKAEYKALGADFDSRNDIMDEYILAMKAAWTGEDFTFKGTGYEALGNRMRPAPVQKPHPPILIGGNSKRAIRRSVDLGDAWNPFFTGPGPLSSTARTQTMNSEEDLAACLAYMDEYCEKVGKKRPLLILASLTKPGDTWDPPALLETIAQYKEMGAVGAAANIEGDTRAEWSRNAERFASEILSKIG